MSGKSRKPVTKGEDIQVELGNFTRIHHAILEKLALIKITGYEFSCLMVLFRETYGYNQKERAISLATWQAGTGIERRNLVRTLNQLVEKRIVYKVDGRAGRANTALWGFNKYTDQWMAEQRQLAVDDEKVCVDTPFSDVSVHTPFDDEKVCVDTPLEAPKKVYQDTPQKVYQDTPQYRKKETTTTTEGSGGSSFPNPSLSTVLRYWQENMQCAVTPIIESDLRQLDAEYGEAVVIDAIGVAVRANKHEMRYVKGVLNRRSPPNGTHMNGTGNHSGKVLIDDD